MALDIDLLQKHLCKHLGDCVKIAVSERDGSIMLDTPFQLPDGDIFPIELMEAENGLIRLTDRGFTYMRISIYDDVDALEAGRRGELLQRVVKESRVEWDYGEVYLETAPEKLAEAAILFGQALTRIWDLTYLSKSIAGGDMNSLPRWWDASCASPAVGSDSRQGHKVK